MKLSNISGKSLVSRISLEYYLFTLFFILTFIYFYFFSDYILFFQEQQFLFIFSGEFFHEHIVKPGGLLVLAGKFLTQFYFSKLAGAGILAAILSLPAVLLLKITKRLFPGYTFPVILLLIPSVIMMLMQSHYYHMMEYNLGFVMILALMLLTVKSETARHRYITIALFPLFYYLTGTYSLIYLSVCIIYFLLFEKGIRRIIFTILLVFIAFASFLVFRKFLFYLPVNQLLFYPLPPVSDQVQKTLLYILISYTVIIIPVGLALNLFRGPLPFKKYLNRASGVLVLLLSLIFLINRYNPQTERVINLEELVFAEKWDKVISYQEKYPAENLIGEYFYNVALSETDQLCDRLFYGRQDFGAGSLILPWSDDHLPWGAYFHYSTGLINEAHRWAYEEMVVYGYRSQNLKMLVKTNLINGHYRMAGKYANILKRSIFYKDWGGEYEKLAGDTTAIMSHPDLGKRVIILPKDDFFIYLEEPQNNLPLLLDANKRNRKAFEYITAWLLLTKNVEAIVNNSGKLNEMGYQKIPRHIEEALLIHYNSTRVMPELGGLKISSETMARFEQYTTAFKSLRQTSTLNKEAMQKRFGNTFWFYFQFR